MVHPMVGGSATRRKSQSSKSGLKRLKKPKPMLTDEYGDPLETCPRCGKQDTIYGFNILGVCGNNLFCTDCHCEFDGDEIHDARKCRQCIAKRIEEKQRR